MNESLRSGRRAFLKGAAVAATGAPQIAAQQAAPPVHSSEDSRPAIEYPRTFSGRHLAMIAFPLGGVAAGSVSLGGRGQLRDWEIFNRPDKGKSVSYAFPGIWVQSGDAKPVAHVLEARLMPPYEAADGLSPNQVSGLTRLESATFTGEYPLARIAFHDRGLPVAVSLEAFTPIIPLDADASGLPVAVLRYTVANPSRQPAKVSIAFSVDNPVGVDLRGVSGRRTVLASRGAEYRSAPALSGLFLTNPEVPGHDPLAGSLALGVTGVGDGKLTWLRGWPRAKWWASPLLFWDDFSSDGLLGPEASERNGVASLCLQREIAPGAKADYTFLLAWHFPNRTPAWCGWQTGTVTSDSSAPEADREAVIGNWYASRFRDAWDVAGHAAANLPSLESRMRGFLKAMRDTTLPDAVKEAAMANLSTLATPTCFRTADGKFRAFEGINDDRGCCYGNCTHVWNYETTTHHLFPALARSMRESAFDLANTLNGVLPIRMVLPEGHQTGGTTAADGTMGQIVKTYLDWQLSGDAAWLARMWPEVKKAIQFAWVDGGWDANRDGVMEGVQHNTYDVEFYGPNPMCGVYYLAALRAGQEMARAAGDGQFADECRRLFSSGSQWIDRNLFNGEHYIQKVRGIPVAQIAPPLRSRGGAEDPEHPDFQLGEGCLTDQLIGQYLADVAGLGPLLDPAHIRTTIATIYRLNRRSSLISHDSVERAYVVNDEAAVLVCDYAPGKRPRIPFPYSSEAWTGMEYLFAAQLIFAGMVREGVQCYEDVRRRFDGERRNPWDEPECGHHYARAMSAWTGILALSGFRYHGEHQAVTAAPRVRREKFRSFWSTATGWGTFSQSIQKGRSEFALEILHGKLPCRSVELALEAAPAAKSSARVDATSLAHELRAGRNGATFLFRDSVPLSEGQRLTLTL